MKTLDINLLAITQAFVHWYERKYHKDNYKLAYRLPIMIWVCSGWVAIAIQHYELSLQNPDIPFGSIFFSCIALCIFYAIVLAVCTTVFMWPFVTIARKNIRDEHANSFINPMIQKNYFIRTSLLILWILILILYFILGGEVVDVKLLGVMPGLVLFIYLVSVQPVQKK